MISTIAQGADPRGRVRLMAEGRSRRKWISPLPVRQGAGAVASNGLATLIPHRVASIDEPPRGSTSAAGYYEKADAKISVFDARPPLRRRRLRGHPRPTRGKASSSLKPISVYRSPATKALMRDPARSSRMTPRPRWPRRSSATLKAINNKTDAYIRPLVTRGSAGTLGLDPRKTTDPQVIIIVDDISLYPAGALRSTA